MGHDKLLLDVGGASLLCRIQDRSRQKENRTPTAMGESDLVMLRERTVPGLRF